MAYVTDMGLLIHFDPKKARTTILEAFRAAKCHKGNTAVRLGCSHRTFLVWVKKLDLDAELDKIYELAARQGWNVVDEMRHALKPRTKKPARKTKAAKKPARKVTRKAA